MMADKQVLHWLQDAQRDFDWTVKYGGDLEAAEGEVKRLARQCIRSGCTVDEVAGAIKEAVTTWQTI
jgi:hypothetical protein